MVQGMTEGTLSEWLSGGESGGTLIVLEFVAFLGVIFFSVLLPHNFVIGMIKCHVNKCSQGDIVGTNLTILLGRMFSLDYIQVWKILGDSFQLLQPAVA